MRIIEDTQLDFCDVLIQPKRSMLDSRKDVNIYRTFTWKAYPTGHQFSLTAIPIMAANMGTVGTVGMAKVLSKNGYMCALEKHYSADEVKTLLNELQQDAMRDGMPICEYTQRVFMTIGVNDPLDAIREVKAACHLTGLVIDIANGYILKLIDKVKEVRKEFPELFIVVGNVVTEDVTTDLILAGANVIKVGIGPSGVCLTRMKSGVGRPQLSAIMDCADAAHQLHAYVMSDGGCVVPGDICKAFCAGADFVMLGGMFAGCDESECDIIIDSAGKSWKKYYGMSSKYAQEKHFGKFNSYRASEGREKLIPASGPLSGIIEDINGSIRSCCTYIGSHELKHMSKHASFYRVNRQLNTVFENCKDF